MMRFTLYAAVMSLVSAVILGSGLLYGAVMSLIYDQPAPPWRLSLGMLVLLTILSILCWWRIFTIWEDR
jgi:xanthosine utilization system XapX-like protein